MERKEKILWRKEEFWNRSGGGIRKQISTLLLVVAILILFLSSQSVLAASTEFVDPSSGLLFSIKSEPTADANGTVTVEGNNYTGTNYTIPAVVTYDGKQYNVTEIGMYAFKDCTSLNNIIIPETVISISISAFENSGLTEIDIPNGVTKIEIKLFNNCSKLTKVNIPGSVTKIERKAFNGCSRLTRVDIPEKVTSIGGSAFENSGLTEVDIPSGVTTIEGSVFNGCSGLTRVGIPESVISIGGFAFADSGLTEVDIPSGVTTIESSVFKDCSGLTRVGLPESVSKIEGNAFNGCSKLTKVDIPEKVTSIGGSAFENSGLSEVDISSGVTTIEGSLFKGCSKLARVGILGSVNKIKGNAFNGCSKLTKVGIPRSVTSIDGYAFADSGLTEVDIPSGVTTIEDSVFKGCSGLLRAGIPGSVTKIESDAFNGCSRLTRVDIPEKVTSIGGSAFAYSGLSEVDIPSGVTTIEGAVFKGCSGLTRVGIPESVISIGGFAFENSGLSEVDIPSGVTTIEGSVFKGCSGLTRVGIPESVTTIEGSAFNDCSRLTRVDIPEKVTSIGGSAFANSGLSEVDIPSGVTTIEGSVFKGCSRLARVGIPGSVTKIESNAFNGCSRLAKVYIPESVSSISKSAFAGCIRLGQLNYLPTPNEDVFGKCGLISTRIVGPAGMTASVIEVGGLLSDPPVKRMDPAGKYCVKIEGLPDGYEVKGLYLLPTNADPPSSPYSISNRFEGPYYHFSGTADRADGIDVAYAYDKTLYVVAMKEGSQERMFFISTKQLPYATADRSYNYPLELYTDYLNPPTWKVIKGRLPNGLILNSITGEISGTPTELGYSSFTVQATHGTASATAELSLWVKKPKNAYKFDPDTGTLTVNDNVGTTAWRTDASIGVTETERYMAIKKLIIQSGVTDIADGSFASCYNLGVAKIPNSVQSIGNSAFKSSGLTSITIPGSVVYFGKEAFQSCSDLTSVTILEGIKTIPESAFKYCRRLSAVTIPKSVQTIENDAFGSSGLTSVIIPGNVTSLSSGVFQLCTKLSSVTIQNGVTAIGSYAFSKCSKLANVIIPESVQTIGQGAFKDCSILTGVTLPGGINSIEKAALSGCRSLAVLSFMGQNPPGTIAPDAFNNVASVGTIYYPADGGNYTETWKSGFSGLTNWIMSNSSVPDAPEFQPPGGTYYGSQSVSVTCGTKDTKIYYTIDGKNPITSGVLYTGPVTIDSKCTLRAVAKTAGNANSMVTEANYVIQPQTGLSGSISVGENSWTDFSGTPIPELFLSEPPEVSIESAVSGAAIEYFTSGEALDEETVKEKTDGWQTYTTAFSLPEDADVVVYARISDGDNTIYLHSGRITVDTAAPGFSLTDGETYTTAQTLTVTDNYALASVIMNEEEQLLQDFSGKETGITLDVNGTYAITAVDRADNTASITVTINISPVEQVAMPEFDPAGGTFANVQNVEITCTTDGASIYYTTDGSDPTTASEKYTEAIQVDSSLTLKAIAVKDGMKNSEVAETVYRIENITTHEHSWKPDWNRDTNYHWHECSVPDCPITVNSGKDGYGEHHESEWITIQQPTEMETGSRKKECMVCRQILMTEDILAIEPDHTHSLTQIESKEPTCVEDGYIEYWYCEGCGKYFSDSEGNSAIDFSDLVTHATGVHTSTGEWQKNAAEHWKVCPDCNQQIDKDIHSGGTANCHSEALCQVCGAPYGAFDPGNHDGDTEVRGKKEATETEKGYIGDTYCLGCNRLLEHGDEIPKLEPVHVHSWAQDWTSDDNYHWHECTVDGCPITENSGKGDHGEHIPSSWITDQQATATTAGSKHKECTTCGHVLEQEIIPATGESPEPGPAPDPSPEPDEPIYTEQILTDTTGVQVGGTFTGDAELEIEEHKHSDGECEKCSGIRKLLERKKLIALFDISLISGQYQNELEVGIPVGQQYNGKPVVIMHFMDKNVESRTVIVSGGIAKGMFSSMSPFAVVETTKADSIELTPSRLSLELGESTQLHANVSPADAYDKKVTWKSSNRKIAEVSDSGQVKAIKSGTATITCMAADGSGAKATCKVTVRNTDTPILIAKATAGKYSVRLNWNEISNADGYEIYGSRCGKNYSYKKIKTITKGSTKTWTQKKLKAATAYKYYIKAYKMVNGRKLYLRVSKTCHTFTTGGKYTNVRAVTATFTDITLSKEKTRQISARVTPVKKGGKLANHVPKFRYKTTNSKVATVTASGKIKAVGKGKCSVYVYANNGVTRRILITVK